MNAARFSHSAVIVALLVGGSVLGFVAPAQAHNYLVSSTPGDGATLTELPTHFSVTTNEALLDLKGDGTGSGIEIMDADGLYYGDGCVTVEGPSVFSTPAIGKPGTYTMIWQVISADGHPVSDKLTFTWAPTGDYTETVGTKLPGDCNGLYLRNGDKAAAGTATATTTVPLSDVLWIGGALAAIVLAGIVTFLLVRPKRTTP
jgi:copper resistance protein C